MGYRVSRYVAIGIFLIATITAGFSANYANLDLRPQSCNRLTSSPITQSQIDSTDLLLLSAGSIIESDAIDCYLTGDWSHLVSFDVNGTGTTIAVIDTGADSNHPDLIGRIIGFKDFVNGYDDMDPGDGIQSYDDNGHGTMVCWAISGTGAGCGYAHTGIAPGANLLVIKALDHYLRGDISIVADAIDFAVLHEVDIICLSLGSGWIEFLQTDEIGNATLNAKEQGILVVASAGNNGPDENTVSNPGVQQYVLTVGASMGNTSVAPFSSRGPVVRENSLPKGNYPKPDVVANGVDVFVGRWSGSTADLPHPDFGENYTLFSGTSAAAPIVAGAAALLKDKVPTATPLELKAAIMSGADDLGLDPMIQGVGLLNITTSLDLIEHSINDMIVVTPKRAPSIPVGSKIQVAEGTTYRQDICVLATKEYGFASIYHEGNFTDFAIISKNGMHIYKGYNNFTLFFIIPQYTSESLCATYEGQVTIEIDDMILAEVEISFSLELFGGRVLFDRGHGLNPSLSRYWTGFEDLCSTQNMIVDTGVTLLDSEILGLTDTLIISHSCRNHTSEEIVAIQDFVHNGGSLIVMGAYYNTTSDESDFNFFDYNTLLEPFGLAFNRFGIGAGFDARHGELYDTHNDSTLISNPLTSGINNIYVAWGSTINTTDNSIAQALLTVDSDSNHAIVAQSEYGEGLVIALSSSSIIDDLARFDGNALGCDNDLFIANLVDVVTPSGPVIYNTETDSADENTIVSIQASIFGCSGGLVTFRIYDQDGLLISQGTPEVEGYLYSYEFVPGTSGTITAIIEISNIDGESRTYGFHFLVFPAVVEISPVVFLIPIAAYVYVLILIKRILDKPQND